LLVARSAGMMRHLHIDLRWLQLAREQHVKLDVFSYIAD
jgi:hypothetical protein